MSEVLEININICYFYSLKLLSILLGILNIQKFKVYFKDLNKKSNIAFSPLLIQKKINLLRIFSLYHILAGGFIFCVKFQILYFFTAVC